MIIIEYCLSGQPVSDFYVEEEYKAVLRCYEGWKEFKDSHTLFYSTDNIFNRIRLGILEDEIDCNEIRFEFNGEEIVINHYGAIRHWPNGFCNLSGNMAEKILLGSFKKYEEERGKEAW
jgi:hypothetical protein